MKEWIAVFLALTGCTGGGDGGTCSSSDDCEAGLDCVESMCIAAHGIRGVIGASALGTNRGTMNVALLPLGTLEVAACVEPIAQNDIQVSEDTVRYALDGVPSGKFLSTRIRNVRILRAVEMS